MNRKPSAIKVVRDVLKIERDSISDLITRVDKNFEKAAELIHTCKGRVVITGMGKPGFIAQKISAMFASIGIPSLFLHPAEATHGDLGRVTSDDVCIAISNSGETEEIIRLLPLLKKIGARMIAMTGNKKSTLAKHSDCVIDVRVKKEACPLGLVPTSSTTCMLAAGDALAVALITRRNFQARDFAFFHPGGALGKRLLLTAGDIMRKDHANPIVTEGAMVKDVLLRITKSRAGAAIVVDRHKKLIGIFTDGDLRRHVNTDPHILERKVETVMTKNPITVKKESLAQEALKLLQDRKIDELPVVDERHQVVGLLDVQDLLKAGLV